MNVTDCFVIEVLLDTLLDVSLEQWLSTFFILVHPFELVRKPVYPCHCTKFSVVKV